MMHNMMGGFGSFFILWMLIGMLFCIVVVGGVIWLFGHWLNKKKPPTMPYTPQPQNPYQTYEQGYQSPQSPPETYQEGGMQYRYPQHQQPQAQYPQEQEMPGQH